MAYPDPAPLQSLRIASTAFVVSQSGNYYTQYVIDVGLVGFNWQVRRRYREFWALDQRLRTTHSLLLSRVYFPERTIFQMSKRVIEERRVALQRYLLEVASISVPSPGHGLIRLRELDSFLQIPEHVCGPGARLAQPALTVPNMLGAAIAETASDVHLAEGISTWVAGSSPPSTPTARSPTGAGRPVGVRRSTDEGDIRAMVQLQARDTTKPDQWRVRDAAEEESYPASLPSKGRRLYDFVRSVTQASASTREAKTIVNFIEQCQSTKLQSPEALLDMVREFIEELAEWILVHRHDDLQPLIDDWLPDGSEAPASISSDSALHTSDFSHLDAPESKVAATGGSSPSSPAAASAGAGSTAADAREAFAVMRRAHSVGDTGGSDVAGAPFTPTTRSKSEGVGLTSFVLDSSLVTIGAMAEDQEAEAKELAGRIARRALEVAVVLPMCADLQYRAMQCSGVADVVVASKLAAVRSVHNQASVPSKVFGIPQELQEGLQLSDASVGHWAEAIQALNDMERHLLPSTQADALLKCVRSIQATAKVLARGDPERLGHPIGADDFFPIFLSILTMSIVQRPATCLNYIQYLTPQEEMGGELSYYVTALESAVYFIGHLHVEPGPDGTIRAGVDTHSGLLTGTSTHVPLDECVLLGADQSHVGLRSVFAAAVAHPMFRAVESHVAASSLARIGAAVVAREHGAALQASAGVVSPPHTADEELTATVGPNHRWPWILHPSPLPDPHYVLISFLSMPTPVAAVPPPPPPKRIFAPPAPAVSAAGHSVELEMQVGPSAPGTPALPAAVEVEMGAARAPRGSLGRSSSDPDLQRARRSSKLFAGGVADTLGSGVAELMPRVRHVLVHQRTHRKFYFQVPRGSGDVQWTLNNPRVVRCRRLQLSLDDDAPLPASPASTRMLMRQASSLLDDGLSPGGDVPHLALDRSVSTAVGGLHRGRRRLSVTDDDILHSGDSYAPVTKESWDGTVLEWCGSFPTFDECVSACQAFFEMGGRQAVERVCMRRDVLEVLL